MVLDQRGQLDREQAAETSAGLMRHGCHMTEIGRADRLAWIQTPPGWC